MSQVRFQAKLESLVTWIPRRPENYCRTVGELDTLLHYLHLVWAKCARREDELAEASKSAKAWPKGRLDDGERVLFLEDRPAVAEKLIDFWREVDPALASPIGEGICLPRFWAWH